MLAILKLGTTKWLWESPASVKSRSSGDNVCRLFFHRVFFSQYKSQTMSEKVDWVKYIEAQEKLTCGVIKTLYNFKEAD